MNGMVVLKSSVGNSVLKNIGLNGFDTAHMKKIVDNNYNEEEFAVLEETDQNEDDSLQQLQELEGKLLLLKLDLHPGLYLEAGHNIGLYGSWLKIKFLQ